MFGWFIYRSDRACVVPRLFVEEVGLSFMCFNNQSENPFGLVHVSPQNGLFGRAHSPLGFLSDQTGNQGAFGI